MVWSVIKTTLFLAVLWTVFLFAVPIGISIVEIEVGIQRFPPQPLIAGPLLLVCTLLVLWSAFTFAIAGSGTPMPFDPPQGLIITGPYAYVRHPFVIGVVGQVVALAIGLGSVPVLIYAAALLLVWYYGIRPGEERVLDERFGEHARAYRKNVRAFRPRLTPFRP